MIDACHGTWPGRLNSGIDNAVDKAGNSTNNSVYLLLKSFLSPDSCRVKFAADSFTATNINHCNNNYYYRYSLAVRSTSLSSWVPLNRVVIIVEMGKLCRRLLYSLWIARLSAPDGTPQVSDW